MARSGNSPAPSPQSVGHVMDATHRRRRARLHAKALRDAHSGNAERLARGFITFFSEELMPLFRGEEERLVALLHDDPVPPVVVHALHDHVELSALVNAMSCEVEARCVDLRVVHRIGDVLERHLLLEEQAVIPWLRSDADVGRIDVAHSRAGEPRHAGGWRG
jgi:hypothetical protein